MPTMKNLIIGNNTYDIVDDEAFKVSGNGREGSCLYVNDSSPYTCNLQLKRINDVNTLNLAVQDDGYLRLTSIDVVDGQEDWSSSGIHELWNVDMTKVFTGTSGKWKYKSASHTQSTAGAWEYTSLSFTVPANHFYLAYVMCNWSNGRPSGIGIHNSSTPASQYGAYYKIESTTGIPRSPIWGIPPGTFYVLVKRDTKSTETNYLYILDLPYSQFVTF